jgi:hypothetical protein
MAQTRQTDKDSSNNNEKAHFKYNVGNCCLYQYKDPNGKIIQVSRPAFVKIKDIE